MDPLHRRLSLCFIPLLMVALLTGCRSEPSLAANLPHRGAGPARLSPTPPTTRPPLSPRSIRGDSREIFAQWLNTSFPQKPDESFGRLLIRIARQQLGKPYFHEPQTDNPEELSIVLDTFQCVSLVETSLSLARCIWKASPDEECFVNEVRKSRYRDGALEGYSSRLHYFYDWLNNNMERGRLIPLTRELGGAPFKRPSNAPLFSIMTGRPERYPALLNPTTYSHIELVENALNKETVYVLRENQLKGLSPHLRDGDLVAVVTTSRGILISHTGFIIKAPDGRSRFLHASSYHKKVVITENDIADYIERKSNRLGIIVYRPEPPEL